MHADARRLVAAPERLSLPHSYALQHCVRARSAGHWEAQEIGRSTQVSLTRTTASTNVASLTSRSGLMFPETLASATGVMIGTSCSSAILLSRHRRRDRAVGDRQWMRTRLFRAHEQAELVGAIADTRAAFEGRDGRDAGSC